MRTLSLALAAAALSAGSAAAQSPADRDGAITLYGWFPSINGEFAAGPIDTIDLGSSDVFDMTDAAFMAVGELRLTDRTGLIVDAVYSDLSRDVASSVTAYDTARVSQETFVATAALTYRLTASDYGFFELLGGARATFSETGLRLISTTQPDAAAETEDSYVDPIIGARGVTELSERWFISGYADIGGFGVSSELTWQAYGGFGYRFTEGVSGVIGYRALGTEYEDGATLTDFTQQGVLIGLSFSR